MVFKFFTKKLLFGSVFVVYHPTFLTLAITAIFGSLLPITPMEAADNTTLRHTSREAVRTKQKKGAPNAKKGVKKRVQHKFNSKTIVKLKLPDLTVKAKWRAGGGVRKMYDFTIRNDGKATAPATQLKITLGPPCLRPSSMTSRVTLATLNIKSLKRTVSKSMEFKIAWELPSKKMGTGCQLRATIDPAKVILESREDNNIGKAGTRHEAKPDLVLVLKWDHTSAVVSGSRGEIGVKNIGDAPAGPSKLNFRCESFAKSVMKGREYWPCNPLSEVGIRDVTWNVPVIAAGGIWWHTLPLRVRDPSNSQWSVHADFAEQIKEWEEGNNTFLGNKY